MNPTRKLALLLLALAACALAGCGKGDLSTPKAAAKTFATAMENGDAEGAKRASTGADPQVIESMAKVTGNMKKMRDAAVAKFGDEGKNMMAGGGPDSTDMAKKVDDADVKEEGDTATLTPKGGGQPIKLKKVNGEWKVDASEMSGAMGSMGSAMFDGMSKAASETTDDINAGKYKTAQEAREAFSSKMMGAALGNVKPPNQPK